MKFIQTNKPPFTGRLTPFRHGFFWKRSHTRGTYSSLPGGKFYAGTEGEKSQNKIPILGDHFCNIHLKFKISLPSRMHSKVNFSIFTLSCALSSSGRGNAFSA